MKRYNPKEIESKWQKVWDKNQTYKADLNSPKLKYYAMSMLNYPSGDGIHIGHAMNYTISDVLARAKRQQGFESYHPVGWDAFGLPAENYAIKTGVSPQALMAKIIPMYHKQYKAMGWSNDWSKEISTHEPEYYKWTQWIFNQMHKHGLAYQASRLQWWCTIDNTVLADEQVTAEGKCWRHDGPNDPLVEKREVKQWFFKITEYAEELLEAINELDWSESVKLAQKNWIGKSVGALIGFAIDGTKDKVQIFTTRPETIYGATFLVVAPEHPSLNQLNMPKAAKDYIKQAIRKTDLERQENKDKTGVFTGVYAINPSTKAKIPIWVADYVLMNYGTGAIMAVPAHDERDWEFAKKYHLPIVHIIEPTFGNPQGDEIHKVGVNVIVRNPKTDKIIILDWGPRHERWGGKLLIGGGAEEGEDLIECAKREIAEETGYIDVKFIAKSPVKGLGYFYSNVKNKNYSIDAHGLYFELVSDKKDKTQLDEGEKQKFKVTWVPTAKVSPQLEDGIHKYFFDTLVLNQRYTGEGRLVNSGAAEPIFVQTVEPGAVRPNEPFVERQAITAIVKHWSEAKYLGLKWKKVNWGTFITGGVEEGQTPEEAARAEIIEETGYLRPVLKKTLPKTHAQFYHVPKKENRLAHFTNLYFELADGEQKETSEEEKGIHDLIWLSANEVEKFLTAESHVYAWQALNDKLPKGAKDYNGMGTSEAREKIVADLAKLGVAKEAVTYRMRDWSVGRQRYWGAPIPVIHCPKCGPQLVPDENLPVILPELKDFESVGDGRSALARATDWLKVACPKCGGDGERETDTMDTYVDSSWYFLRYLDPANNQKIFDSQVANKWMPVDFYNGADHATAHMLYARFVTRFFAKTGLVMTLEPFKHFLFNGKVTAQDGQMFSKSKGNGVDPLEIIAQGYGADALRTYLMFAAPLDQWVRWDPQGVPGTYRFLSRLWNLTFEFLAAKAGDGSAEAVKRYINKAIKKVTEDIEARKYNTAIAAMMQCVNLLYTEKANNGFADHKAWQAALESLVQLVAPFAPHIAEELWHELGHQDSIHVDHWPTWDEKLVAEETVTLAVQINGKVRGEIILPPDAGQDGALEAAKADPKVVDHLKTKKIKKVIYVQGRLISLVTD